ncbi:chemotaxis protein CheW [Elongatibacter sediminis]|uniref:Chemotaxis protein CheW n=1 Tax=Elongatibacter sediminis TaxID=3119006 RepID=A0AAW9R5R4_9GAMM
MSTKKTTTRKKTAAKKSTAKKTVAKKTGAKKAVRKKSTRRGVSARRKSAARGRKPTRREARAEARALNGTTAPAPEVHCALASTGGVNLLLPTNVVAEVIEYVQPAPMQDTPDWFLGQVEWDDRQVPVFSYAALISGEASDEPGPHARIVVLKSLSDSTRVPYLGVVTLDIPKLLSVQISDLEHTGDDRKSMGVYCHVKFNEEPAVIPDLDRLTHLVTHAAYGALPLTRAPG